MRDARVRATASGRRLAVCLVLGTGLLGARRAKQHPDYLGTQERHGRPPSALRIGLHDEPEQLDPALVSDAVAAELADNMFEGLVRRHPKDLRPVAGMADRYSRSDDGLVYRFRLRDDARWSDGKKLVAADFIYAWQRVLRPSTAARSVTLLYPLKNAEHFYRGTVQVARRKLSLAGGQVAPGAPLEIVLRGPVKSRLALLEQPQAGRFRRNGDGFSFRVEEQQQKLSQGPMRSLRIVGRYRGGERHLCNGKATSMYRLKDSAGREGWLPACALRSVERPTHAWVRRFSDMPHFFDGAAKARPSVEAAEGRVKLSELERSASILGARAVGERTVEIELRGPTPYLLDLVAYPVWFPLRQDVIERHGERWTRPENIVQNGPYLLKEHAFRYAFRMRKNPHYHAHAKLKVDDLRFLLVGDLHAALALYTTGELDWLGSTLALPPSHQARLRRYRDVEQAPYISTYWYEFNTRKKPVDDVRVRRALNMAIDKQSLVTHVTRAGQTPASHYVPESVGFGYAEALKEDPERFKKPGLLFDPAGARALLGEAGYPVEKLGDGRYRAKGFPDLELSYNTSDGNRSVAVAVQAMWHKHLGIRVGLRNKEWKVFLKQLRDGQFQVARFGWAADYNHAHTFLDVFLSYSKNNLTRWKSPEVDALVKAAAATQDPKKSSRLYLQAEEKALAAMPRIPLYFYTKTTLKKPYLKGLWSNALNRHPAQFMWVDKDWQQQAANRPAYEPAPLREEPLSNKAGD